MSNDNDTSTVTSEPELAAAPIKSTPPPAGPSAGRRVVIGFNVATQAVIVFVILILVNWVSNRHFKRWDHTRDHSYALSSQTTSLLSRLPKPVKAFVYFGGGLFGEVAPDALAVLREYEYAAKGKLTVEQVDPSRNLQRASELSERYKIGELENIVILDYEGKSKFVQARDMVDLDMSGVMQQQKPQIKAFKGEAAITAGLMELVEGKQQKLYLTDGHGESTIVTEASGRPDDVWIFGEMLKRTNIKHERLNLLDAERVPEDATAVMIFGPKQDLSEREIALLDQYWNSKGRILVTLKGNTKTPRLNAWLAKVGVKPLGGQIFAQLQRRSPTGERTIETIQDGVGKFSEGDKTVLGDLGGQNVPLLGPTTALEIDKEMRATNQISFNLLIESAKQFWLDVDPFDGQTPPTRDPAREKEGPFALAVSVEKGGLEGVKVDTSRLIVIANAGFLTDNAINSYSGGLDFAINSVSWLMNRDQSVGIGIPPKEKNLVALSLDPIALRDLALSVVFGIPLIVAAIGTVTCLRRRR